jgi:flagellar biosynthesis/type III secretory pathway protein FliH
MPSVVEAIQAKLGEMKNIRIEPETELRGRGLILESENNLIDGSMESLFATIDKMFASVVNHE